MFFQSRASEAEVQAAVSNLVRSRSKHLQERTVPVRVPRGLPISHFIQRRVRTRIEVEKPDIFSRTLMAVLILMACTWEGANIRGSQIETPLRVRCGIIRVNVALGRAASRETLKTRCCLFRSRQTR